MRVGLNRVEYSGRAYSLNNKSDIGRLLWAMYFNGEDLSVNALTTRHNVHRAPTLSEKHIGGNKNIGSVADILFSYILPDKGKSRSKTRGYFLRGGNAGNRVKGFAAEYLALLPLLVMQKHNPQLRLPSAVDQKLFMFEQRSLSLKGFLPPMGSQGITGIYGREDMTLLNYSTLEEPNKYADIRIDIGEYSVAVEVKNYHALPSHNALYTSIINKYQIRPGNGGEVGRRWRTDSKKITHRLLLLATPEYLEKEILAKFSQVASENNDGIPWIPVSFNQVGWRQLYESALDLLVQERSDLLFQSQVPLVHGEKKSPTSFMMSIYDSVVDKSYIISRRPHVSMAMFTYLALKYLSQEVKEPTLPRNNTIILNEEEFPSPPHIIIREGVDDVSYKIISNHKFPEKVVFLDLETASLGDYSSAEIDEDKIVGSGHLHSGAFICVAGLGYQKGTSLVVEQRIVHNPYLEEDALRWLINHLQNKTVYTHGNFDQTMLRERMIANLLTPGLLKRTKFIDIGQKVRASLESFERAYLQSVFGWRCEADIGSEEVPNLFWSYMRGGSCRSLEQILDHNYYDVVSLAAEQAVLEKEGKEKVMQTIASTNDPGGRVIFREVVDHKVPF